MNYNKVEELYVDFILDIIGPNQERENQRKINLSIIKDIITKTFETKLPDFKTYIKAYGSYPIKTYLNNADIDITIFFESKKEQKVLIELPIDVINKAIIIIKEEFERYNKESAFELFSDIRIILADIRLLKCKIGSISLDISINNFSGLFKIIFINYIEDQFQSQFIKKNLFPDSPYIDNKINIFRRSLLLIKGWCLLEGNLMGSNIGLMASYAIEILVIFIFNLHYEYIYNELDAFEKFFEFMENMNWENNVISLFGIFSNQYFHTILSSLNSKIQKDKKNIIDINEPFWYIKNIYNNKSQVNSIKMNSFSATSCEPLLKINELKKLISPINKGISNTYLKQKIKMINESIFGKSINILDPINNCNNLGKSISLHSYSKMKQVIIYLNKQLKSIHKTRKKGNPILYLNSLLNLFKTTLSKNFIELFINSINCPRILSNSKIYNVNNLTNKKRIKIEKKDIKKFNNLFNENKSDNDKNYFDDEEYDQYEEESEDGKLCSSEKDSEENYEEDEYLDEEEEVIDEDVKANKTYKEGKIKFIPLISNQVIKKIFEIYENRQEIIKSNNQLTIESMNYSNELGQFLKLHKLI